MEAKSPKAKQFITRTSNELKLLMKIGIGDNFYSLRQGKLFRVQQAKIKELESTSDKKEVLCKINIFSHSIKEYHEGKDRNILVTSTLLMKQSHFKSDVQTKEAFMKLLADYNKLASSEGIFGRFPKGHEKNQ